MDKKIITTVLRSIALAIGVLVILLNIFGNITIDTAITPLAVGLTALAIAELQKEQEIKVKAEETL